MELELKHLTPYLSYGLEVILSEKGIFNLDSEYGTPPEATKPMAIINMIISDIVEIEIYSEKTNWGVGYIELDEVLLVLRPLSELNSKIQIAEYFCTFKEHLNRIYPTETMGLNPATWSHRAIEWCLQYHFDVFGLIPKGLAVSL